MAVGLAIALHLPLPAPLRMLAAALWLSGQTLELAAFSRAAARWRRLAIGAQGVRALFENGIWRELRLCPGSVVTPRFAWLRLADTEGRSTCAVLRASSVPGSAWRRLTAWYRAAR